MDFEFDSGKNEINLAKHGLSLEQAKALWTVNGVEGRLGMVNNEFRYLRLAELHGVIHVAFFTYRSGSTVRLISARIASQREISLYEQNRS